MLDGYGREIDYIRISVTDRCDMRCVYCMPEQGVECKAHEDILRYEEILQIARAAVRLGIKKFRITGGEPLTRKGIPFLVRELKSIDGVQAVHMTTNGNMLYDMLPELMAAGLDGVNISIDAVDGEIFRRITRRDASSRVLRSIDAAIKTPGLSVKINCVPTKMNESQFVPLVKYFLTDNDISLRFIELMPIGYGSTMEFISEARIIEMLEPELGRLTLIKNDDSREKARYYTAEGIKGKIGFISAVSHKFCDSCNRIRLMSNGFLKTCLQYEDGVALKPYLGGSDEELLEAMKTAILRKPACHHFSDSGKRSSDEIRGMSQIGG